MVKKGSSSNHHPGTAGTLAVLAFDSAPERNMSLPATEPMVGALPSGTAEAIRDEVQAYLVRLLDPRDGSPPQRNCSWLKPGIKPPPNRASPEPSFLEDHHPEGPAKPGRIFCQSPLFS